MTHDRTGHSALRDALASRGWALLGRVEWTGVAVHAPSLTLVAGVPIGSPTLRFSGCGPRWPGLLGQALCPFCLGTTRIDDVQYCEECSGGMVYRSTWSSYPVPWPRFRPNPAGKAWHVERHGDVLAAGRGIRAVGRIVTPAVRSMRALQLVTRIERAAGFCACPACQDTAQRPRAPGAPCPSCWGTGRALRVQA